MATQISDQGDYYRIVFDTDVITNEVVLNLPVALSGLSSIKNLVRCFLKVRFVDRVGEFSLAVSQKGAIGSFKILGTSPEASVWYGADFIATLSQPLIVYPVEIGRATPVGYGTIDISKSFSFDILSVTYEEELLS